MRQTLLKLILLALRDRGSSNTETLDTLFFSGLKVSGTKLDCIYFSGATNTTAMVYNSNCMQREKELSKENVLFGLMLDV